MCHFNKSGIFFNTRCTVVFLCWAQKIYTVTVYLVSMVTFFIKLLFLKYKSEVFLCCSNPTWRLWGGEKYKTRAGDSSFAVSAVVGLTGQLCTLLILVFRALTFGSTRNRLFADAVWRVESDRWSRVRARERRSKPRRRECWLSGHPTLPSWGGESRKPAGICERKVLVNGRITLEVGYF